MDSLLYIGLIELLAIEFLVLILLLIFLRRRKKPEQITDNIPIKHVDEVKQDLPKIEKIKEKRRERKKKSNIHFGKWFNSLIPRKSEQWIILVIYIAVLVIAGYFFLANIFPDKVPTLQDNFVISASSMQIFDKLNSLSIDKDSILGQKETIDNQVIRKIASAEPFNLVLNPKTPLKADSPASLELNLVTSGAGTDVYMNDKPIIPNLANYNLVADFKDEAVYVSKNLSSYYTSSSLIKGNSAQDFAYKNFPGASVYSFSTSASYIPDIEGYKKTTTAMVLIFRDNLKLGVFAEGDLQVKFTKQDLNSYVGKDEYTVEIKDLNGKSYFNKTYQDSDGDVSKSGKQP